MRPVGKFSTSLVLATTVYLQAETRCPADPIFERLPSPIVFDPGVVTSTAVEGFGWVVADQPSTTSYSPSTTKQYNSSGETNVVTRAAVGRYTVAFAGLGGIHGGNVQVTAMGDGPTHCKVRHWTAKFGTVSASIACFDAGLAVDSAFVASFQASRTVTPLETAYAWVPSTATGVSFTPAAAYARNVASVYLPTHQISLAGPITALAIQHVTAYGNGAEHCVFRENRGVNCFDALGNRLTSPAFSYATGMGRISTSIPSDLEGAFGVMDQPWDWVTTTNATPQGSTLSSGSMSVTKTGTGRYSVDIPYPSFFSRSSVPSMVHVTALDITGRNVPTQCKVASWSDDGTTRVTIAVRCFSMAPATFGAPQNMGFHASYIVRPTPIFTFPFPPFKFGEAIDSF